MFAGKLSRTLFPHALAPLVLHAAQTAAQSAFAVRRVKSQAKSEVDNPAAFFMRRDLRRTWQKRYTGRRACRHVAIVC